MKLIYIIYILPMIEYVIHSLASVMILGMVIFIFFIVYRLLLHDSEDGGSDETTCEINGTNICEGLWYIK